MLASMATAAAPTITGISRLDDAAIRVDLAAIQSNDALGASVESSYLDSHGRTLRSGSAAAWTIAAIPDLCTPDAADPTTMSCVVAIAAPARFRVCRIPARPCRPLPAYCAARVPPCTRLPLGCEGEVVCTAWVGEPS